MTRVVWVFQFTCIPSLLFQMGDNITRYKGPRRNAEELIGMATPLLSGS
jgi:hypothetical protein